MGQSFGRTVFAFYKLGRPSTSLAGAVAVVMGGYVAQTGAWDKIALATLVTLLTSVSSNAWNDCLDLEIDRVNRPDRVLPSGLLSRVQAAVFSVAMALLAILVSLTINPTAFWITTVSNVVLYVYSWKLKSTVLVGNVVVAVVSAFSVIFGGVAAGNAQAALPLAATIVVVIMGREILKTMADYEGDLSQRVRTVATVWGRERTRILCVSFLAAAPIVMLLPALLQQYRPVYVVMLAVGVFPVLVYIMFNIRPDAPARKLERLSQLIKWDFFVWFVAVLLGTPA